MIPLTSWITLRGAGMLGTCWMRVLKRFDRKVAVLRVGRKRRVGAQVTFLKVSSFNLRGVGISDCDRAPGFDEQ